MLLLVLLQRRVVVPCIAGFKSSPPAGLLSPDPVAAVSTPISVVSATDSERVQAQDADLHRGGNEAIRRCRAGYTNYVRCLQWIEDKLSLMVSRLGEESARRPCRTICICIAFAFICSFGLVRLNIVSDAESLWVDPNAPSSVNKRWVDSVYGPQARLIRVLVVNDAEDGASVPAGVCANTDGTQSNTAPCACGDKRTTCAAESHCFAEHSMCFRNTLSVEAFREMLVLDQRLRELTVKGKRKKRFVDFCYKSVLPGSPCLINSPLEIWSAPSLPFGDKEGKQTGECADTPGSQLNLATAGRIQSCSALVAELKDNNMDCSLDLSQFGFRGSPADVCCKACRDAALASGPKKVRVEVPEMPDDTPGDCVPTGQLQWAPGPQLRRFEQTVDRCDTVRARCT